ncbi:uncharacterized protein [Periplaneta americana]
MATGGRMEQSQLLSAIGDMGKRIPVVKLERVEDLYPTFHKVAQKPVVPSYKIDKVKKKQGVVKISKDVKKIVTDGCVGAMFPDSSKDESRSVAVSSSEPPKKQHKLEEEPEQSTSGLPGSSVPDKLRATEERKSVDENLVEKVEVVNVDCDPTALTFSRTDDPPTDPLSTENNGLRVKTQAYLTNNTCGVFPQSFNEIGDNKVNPPAFWERNRPQTESLPFPNVSGGGIRMPTYSENLEPRLDNRQLAFSSNSLAYSRDNRPGISPPTYSGVIRPHLNNTSGMNPPLFPGPSINPSTYPGHSDSGINTQSYSGNNRHEISSLSYSGYDRQVCSGSNQTTLNSLAYIANNRSVLSPIYYGDNGHGLTPQTFSGSNTTRVNTPSYSGNNGPGITSQTYSGSNESGVNTLAYSGNSGHAINSSTYCGNKGRGINTLTYTGSSGVGMNSQTYAQGSGSSYSGDSVLGMNSHAFRANSRPAVDPSNYSANSGTTMSSPGYAVSSGSAVNTSGYSSSSGSGINSVTREIGYTGNSSFTGNEMTQQYQVLQNYCANGDSGIDNTSCQDTWSNDYITLNSLPTNGYQLADCTQDFSFMFTCQVCGNMVTVADELVKHWRQHNGVDSLTCTACYVSFTDVLFLQAHWKAIHMGGVCSDSGVVLRNDQKIAPQLVCEACGFAFSQFTSLEQHVMSTHVNHRDSVSWRSSNMGDALYGIGNTNNVISNKNPQSVPIMNNHALTKQTTLQNSIVRSDDQDHSIIQLENSMHSMIKQSTVVNATESDDEMSDDGSRHGMNIETLESSSGMQTNTMKSEADDVEEDSSLADSENQNGKLLKCNICGSKSYGVNELMKHWRIHIGANSMTCTLCKKTFSDLPFLQAHWRRSHMQGNSVPNSVSRSHLLQNEPSYLCETCGYAFSDLLLLEQHLISTHVVPGSTDGPPMRTLVETRHKQLGSVNKIRSFNCASPKIQLLDQGTKEASDKQKEVSVKTKCVSLGVKRTKNRDGCLVCGETSQDMIKHLVTHTGVLSLQCCLCGKDFVDVPFLQAHWRATHMNGEVRHTNNGIYVGSYKENISGKEKLLCETCGCYVPKFSALEKHIILAHTVIRPPYECKCDDVFASEDELKTHISTCNW